MDRQTLILKMQEVFKTLTPEIFYTVETPYKHFVVIVSESFKNKSMDERMNMVLSCVKRSPEMQALDIEYDFTYFPTTPNENKNKTNTDFHLEDGSVDSFDHVAKPPEI